MTPADRTPGELGRAIDRIERSLTDMERRLDAIPGWYVTASEGDRIEHRLQRDIATNRAAIADIKASSEADMRHARSQVRGALITSLVSLLSSVFAAVLIAQLVERA